MALRWSLALLAGLTLASGCGRADLVQLPTTTLDAATVVDSDGATGDGGTSVEADGAPATDADPMAFADATPEPTDSGVILVDGGPSGTDGGSALSDALPGDAAPGDAVPRDALPGDALPGDAVPGDAGRDATPGDATPPDATPGDGGATDGGAPRCTSDQDCGMGGGFNSFCEPVSGQCVRCWNDMQCPRRNVCDTTTFSCRPTCFQGQCPGDQVCDTTTNACVECLADSDCNGNQVCNVATRTCVQCQTNAECVGIVDRNLCAPSTNTCVECLADTDCAAGQACASGACVTNGARAICEPCDADDQCGGAADLCIGLFSGGTFIDRSCATDCSAPGATCPSGFDCVSVRNGGARQCRPSYPMQNPSCFAIRNVGDACVFDAVNVDPGCGLPGRQDARCVLSPMSGAGVCTIFCASDADCPNGTLCTTAMNPGGTGYCL
jgi:Cys-rich repeat protein